MKLLIGGSPCTHWSIAQTRARETEPEGIGWELFLNYVIAKQKYNPDYFLYENNKSMSPEIRDQITRELGVNPILINSALVSAQNRERLYWTNIPGVERPKDRGIVVQDILESGYSLREKSYAILSNSGGTTAEDMLKRRQRNGAAEEVFVGECKTIDTAIPDIDKKIGYIPEMFNAYNRAEISEKAPTLSTGSMVTSSCAVTKFEKTEFRKTVEWPVYTVKNGFISIKGNEYRTKLKDGLYIIRKLTVIECMRLQTVPEWYIFPVSPTQAYKMLGNGWTVDVIAHILSYCPGIFDEPIEVFSMYDGMSCGRLALEKLGAEITRYYATEIDKYAIKTTQANFPDTIQLGDAFQVREEGWCLPKEREEPT